MPSYSDRNELIKMLSNQAYFDAINKPKDPAKPIQVVGKDGQTGRSLLSHPDGGVTSNGVQRFNTAVPQDGFVAARIDPYSNAIAIDGRQRRETARVNQILEEVLTSNIAAVSASGTAISVFNGDTTDEVYQIPLIENSDEPAWTVIYTAINKTGTDLDDWLVNAVLRKKLENPFTVSADYLFISIEANNTKTFAANIPSVDPEGYEFNYPVAFTLSGSNRLTEGLTGISIFYQNNFASWIDISNTKTNPPSTRKKFTGTAQTNGRLPYNINLYRNGEPIAGLIVYKENFSDPEPNIIYTLATDLFDNDNPLFGGLTSYSVTVNGVGTILYLGGQDSSLLGVAPRSFSDYGVAATYTMSIDEDVAESIVEPTAISYSNKFRVYSFVDGVTTLEDSQYLSFTNDSTPDPTQTIVINQKTNKSTSVPQTYSRAIRQPDLRSNNRLGLIYLNGTGVGTEIIRSSFGSPIGFFEGQFNTFIVERYQGRVVNERGILAIGKNGESSLVEKFSRVEVIEGVPTNVFDYIYYDGNTSVTFTKEDLTTPSNLYANPVPTPENPEPIPDPRNDSLVFNICIGSLNLIDGKLYLATKFNTEEKTGDGLIVDLSKPLPTFTKFDIEYTGDLSGNISVIEP